MDNENDDGDAAAEAEYIRLTDLTKLRIARNILNDVMAQSLPSRNEMVRQIYEAIRKLEGKR